MNKIKYFHRIYASSLEAAIENAKELAISQGAKDYRGRSGTIYDVGKFKEIPFETNGTNISRDINEFVEAIYNNHIQDVDSFEYIVGFKTGLSRQTPKKVVSNLDEVITEKNEVKWKTVYKVTDKLGYDLEGYLKYLKEELTFSTKREAYEKAQKLAIKEMMPLKVKVQKVIAEEGTDELKAFVPNIEIIEVTEYQYIICGWAPSY